VALLAPVSARAQDSAADAAENAKIHLGPLGLSPRIALSNVGIDTNVLSTSVAPQRDFTSTFLPGLDSWLRIGRGVLSGKTGAELVYFTKTTAQRSIGLSQEGRFDLVLNHFTPHVSAGDVTTYRRPNAEIDTRIRQNTKSFGVGATLQAGWRAILVMEASRDRLELGREEFQGISLAQALDRQTRTVALNLRVAVTPLTTFVVRNTLQQDRFTFLADRDTDSVSVVPGFEFKPSALVSGSAFVGVRSFQPKQATEPGFTGVVAAVSLGYVLRDSTRFDGKIDRNVDYSFEPGQPYFLATGGSLSVTQAVGGNWDAVVRVSRQRLDYRALVMPGALPPVTDRLDRVAAYGAGVGYRLDVDARIGFDVTYARRLSPLDSRRYDGFQFGGSFRYGF
jgi:hypothetical protein